MSTTRAAKKLKDDLDKHRLLDYMELMGLPKSRAIVKGLIHEKEIGMIYGSSMAGKSFLTIDMLHSIANGRDWFGYRVNEHHPVVYFALEGKGGITKRMSAIEAKHGLRTMGNFAFMVHTFDLTDPDEVKVWASRINDRKLISPVIAIDTLAQAAVGRDENGSEGMGMVLAGAQELSLLTGGTVILIHHAGKDATRGARGWSGLKGAMDFQIEVTHDEEKKVRSWKAEKVKEDSSGKSHKFALDVVELYKDTDGDIVTTCLIKEVLDSYERPPTDAMNADQVYRFLCSSIEEKKYYSKNALETTCLEQLGLTQKQLRAALSVLSTELRIADTPVPSKTAKKGGAQKYLHPVGYESVFVKAA
jgi:RecA-family ATPase